MCLGAGPDGTAIRRVVNSIAAPPGQERAVWDGLGALFPTPVGKEARHSSFRGYSNDPTNTGHMMERWRTLGGQTLTVGGAPVQTVMFQCEIYESQRYNTHLGRWLFWFAPEGGIWVRSEALL